MEEGIQTSQNLFLSENGKGRRIGERRTDDRRRIENDNYLQEGNSRQDKRVCKDRRLSERRTFERRVAPSRPGRTADFEQIVKVRMTGEGLARLFESLYRTKRAFTRQPDDVGKEIAQKPELTQRKPLLNTKVESAKTYRPIVPLGIPKHYVGLEEGYLKKIKSFAANHFASLTKFSKKWWLRLRGLAGF